MCYVANSFVCADFAEMLHNNAEKAGWRAAFVGITLSGGETHALDAFETTDLGLVYIDCTGMPCTAPRPMKTDSRVNVAVGEPYIPECIFPQPGWSCTENSIGVVTKIDVMQW
jgi:hypothetical protein